MELATGSQLLERKQQPDPFDGTGCFRSWSRYDYGNDKGRVSIKLIRPSHFVRV